ncbi:MAG: DUF1385 domain-containing protein [Wujia sp.]
MERVSIGGQAVIEGVMMKNGSKYAVAVRKPDKEIEVQVKNYKPVSEKHKICKAPVIRGVFNFVESMVIGVKTLTYSAEFYEDEEDSSKDSKKQADAGQANEHTENKSEKESKKDKSDDWVMFGTVAFSIVLAVGLFMLLPAWIAGLLDKVIDNHVLLGLLEGFLRLGIFLLYVFAISRMEDIKRTFMYHGAEHKTINCLEHGEDLTVENVMKHSRFHKRCGTSFLFIVMFVSILVFMCITAKSMWLRLLLRVLLVPVIAGISYEFIRYAGSHDSWFADAMSKPGLWIQRLTTIEPEPDMVEVAIRSVEAVFDWKAYLEEQRSGAHTE